MATEAHGAQFCMLTFTVSGLFCFRGLLPAKIIFKNVFYDGVGMKTSILI